MSYVVLSSHDDIRHSLLLCSFNIFFFLCLGSRFCFHDVLTTLYMHSTRHDYFKHFLCTSTLLRDDLTHSVHSSPDVILCGWLGSKHHLTNSIHSHHWTWPFNSLSTLTLLDMTFNSLYTLTLPGIIFQPSYRLTLISLTLMDIFPILYTHTTWQLKNKTKNKQVYSGNMHSSCTINIPQSFPISLSYLK